MINLVLIIGYIVLVCLMPFAFIWSLNTLFELSISYTITTWLAVVFLLAAIGSIKVKIRGE